MHEAKQSGKKKLCLIIVCLFTNKQRHMLDKMDRKEGDASERTGLQTMVCQRNSTIVLVGFLCEPPCGVMPQFDPPFLPCSSLTLTGVFFLLQDVFLLANVYIYVKSVSSGHWYFYITAECKLLLL